MKTRYMFIGLLCFALIAATNCTKESSYGLDVSDYTSVKLDTIIFSHSMKGWELYSWPISTNWKYSLMVGTNAVKTYEQVVNNRLSVIGEDSLKVLLSKMPANEEISWLGKVWLQTSWQSSFGELNLPKRTTQIEIKEFCDNHGLKLTIIE
jgi:hypothetical protein